MDTAGSRSAHRRGSSSSTRAPSTRSSAGRNQIASSSARAGKFRRSLRIIQSFGKTLYPRCESPREFGRNDFGVDDEAETLADIVERRRHAVIGRRSGRAVLDQKTVVAEEIGALQRAQHALIGI